MPCQPGRYLEWSLGQCSLVVPEAQERSRPLIQRQAVVPNIVQSVGLSSCGTNNVSSSGGRTIAKPSLALLLSFVSFCFLQTMDPVYSMNLELNK